VVKKCKTTYKKTWAELGQITSKGQTTAGQKAEKMIASAVADLIKETMIRKCRQGK
jgi:hypothetical protein